MSRTSYEPEGRITYKKPPPRRKTRATWAPPLIVSRRPSFVPWHEMVEPRFPRPPRMPRDLKAPVPMAVLDGELLDDEDDELLLELEDDEEELLLLDEDDVEGPPQSGSAAQVTTVSAALALTEANWASVTVTVWEPRVARVTANEPTPALSAKSAGSVAAPSLLLTCTTPW